MPLWYTLGHDHGQGKLCNHTCTALGEPPLCLDPDAVQATATLAIAPSMRPATLNKRFQTASNSVYEVGDNGITGLDIIIVDISRKVHENYRVFHGAPRCTISLGTMKQNLAPLYNAQK